MTDIEIVVEPASPTDAQEYLQLGNLSDKEKHDLMAKNQAELKSSTGKVRIRIVYAPGGEKQAIKQAEALATRLGGKVVR
jgi:peptidoglycan/xylan/chitin deacetylase (PgdA/CDA1 family)